MDKKSVKIIFCVSLALILSLSLVSAGWFDWVGKITGRPVGECVDSDGGKNYFVKGSCSGEGSGTDSCISTTMLKEYFCMPQDFICIEDYYACGTGYKCELGKCVLIPPTYDGKCVDGERGTDITAEVYVAFSYSNDLSLFEICEEALYGTWTCYNDNGCVSNETCLSGKCVENILNESSINETEENLEINCSDTDGGIDYYLEGTCSDSLGNFTDIYSGTALIEYFCLNNVCTSVAPFVCEKGEGNACFVENEIIEPEEIIQTGCLELNGKNLSFSVPPGKRMNEEGVIYYCDVFSLEFKEAKQKEEICDDDYECISNDCSSGKCSSVYEEIGKQTELIEEQGSFLRKIWCGILHPVDVTKRNQEGETIENNGWLSCIARGGEECSDSCSSLGYECGIQNICEEEVDCGVCDIGQSCNSLIGVCEDNPSLWLVQANGDLKECDSSGNCSSHGYEAGNHVISDGTQKMFMVAYNNKLWLITNNYTGWVTETHLKECDSSGNCIDHGNKANNAISLLVYNNKLWIGETYGGLKECDSSGNCINKGDKGVFIYSMVVYNNKLWLSMYREELVSCDFSGNCTSYGDKGSHITSMAVYDNKLWIGQHSGILQSCDSLGTCTPHGDKGNEISSIAVYNNKLWIGDLYGGLKECDSSGNCIDHGQNGKGIGSMVVYNNKLWLGSGNVLYSCDEMGACINHGQQGSGNKIVSMAVYPPEE